jgi:hypothetical protein
MARPGRLLPVLSLLALACATPSGNRVTPEEYERIEQSARAASVLDQAGDSREGRAKEESLDGRGRELADRQAEAAFQAGELAHKRDRMALQHASEVARQTVSRHRAVLELEHAKTALASFDAEVEPRRLAQDALDLQRSQDNLLEQREELAQLELMYAGSELGEGTAEIVLERTRRRIGRAESSYELRKQQSRMLREVELPHERERLVMDLAEKEVGAANAERELTLGELDRAAALRELAHEEEASERRLADLERDELELEQARRDAERVSMGESFPEDTGA